MNNKINQTNKSPDQPGNIESNPPQYEDFTYSIKIILFTILFFILLFYLQTFLCNLLVSFLLSSLETIYLS